MTQNIAAIGLGSMGSGMASSALRAGFDVAVFDINAEAVARLEAEGGRTGSVAQIGPEIAAAMVTVLNAAQTETVLFGPDGIVPHMTAGSVVLSCATVPPAFAKDMADRCGQHGVLYLDAPISGGAARAAQGDLSIMAAGTKAAFDAAAPLLDAIASQVFRIGDTPGAGSAMKAVNQLLAGVHIATMAEAMSLGITQGISPEKFMEVIPHCAGSSWMLENRGPHIVEGDYTPRSSVTIWPKDLGIVREIAESAGLATPIAEAALARYQRAVEDGIGAEDDAAVIKTYAAETGFVLPEGE